jgi:hypothetical protein
VAAAGVEDTNTSSVDWSEGIVALDHRGIERIYRAVPATTVVTVECGERTQRLSRRGFDGVGLSNCGADNVIEPASRWSSTRPGASISDGRSTAGLPLHVGAWRQYAAVDSLLSDAVELDPGSRWSGWSRLSLAPEPKQVSVDLGAVVVDILGSAVSWQPVVAAALQEALGGRLAAGSVDVDWTSLATQWHAAAGLGLPSTAGGTNSTDGGCVGCSSLGQLAGALGNLLEEKAPRGDRPDVPQASARSIRWAHSSDAID